MLWLTSSAFGVIPGQWKGPNSIWTWGGIRTVPPLDCSICARNVKYSVCEIWVLILWSANPLCVVNHLFLCFESKYFCSYWQYEFALFWFINIILITCNSCSYVYPGTFIPLDELFVSIFWFLSLLIPVHNKLACALFYIQQNKVIWKLRPVFTELTCYLWELVYILFHIRIILVWNCIGYQYRYNKATQDLPPTGSEM